MVKVGAVVEDETNVNINVIDFITVLILATPLLYWAYFYISWDFYFLGSSDLLLLMKSDKCQFQAEIKRAIL